jgi:hypothetical protein
MIVHLACSSLPRLAGEGWGGGQHPLGLAQRCAPGAPLPASLRMRGEVLSQEAGRCLS